MEDEVGRIVILNGVSSAGKTTLAEGFRARRAGDGEPWLVIGVDDFLGKLPDDWYSVGDHHGRFSTDGVRFEPVDDGVLPAFGVVGYRLMAAYHAAVSAVAVSGFDVVVDEVVRDERIHADWLVALEGLDVTWVKVHCADDVAVAREAARGDREIGLARSLTRVVHLHPNYDIEIDTGALDPEAAAIALERALGY